MTIQRSVQAAAIFCLVVASSVFSMASVKKHDSSNVVTPAGCTGGAALNGWYGIMVSSGRYLSGAVNFDGNCGLSGANLTGALSGQASSSTSVTGSYGQNSDGTYNLILNLAGQATAQSYTIGVGASGTKAVGIENDNSAVAYIDIESQLTSLTNGYTTASLSGAYAVSCSGSGVDLNYVTFDGKGNLNGVNPYDIGGSQGNSPYSGTYSVNPDGTFMGALAGSYSQFTFAGVIDNGVSEIEYTYDQNGNESVSCSGRQSSTANLTGYYGMVVGGNATNGISGGKYLSGSVYFDGIGGLTATNVNGGINTQYVNSTATGSYVVNSDNTITITMNLSGQPTAQTYIVAVGEGGNEADGIETDGTAQAIVDFQAQLVTNSTSYTNASLNGTYAAYCTGSEVDVNYVTFDGNGNQTGVDPYDNGSYGSNPYVGTYSVNPDGTFDGAFTGAYTLYTSTGIIDNANSEIEYTYQYDNTGGVVYCIGYSTYGQVGTAPVAATPSFNPAPGAYSTAQTVTLSTTTPGAQIYYTINGVTPTSSSLLYSNNPITVSPNTTIEAIAVANGFNNSAIAAGTYFQGASLPTAVTPTFNPLPGNFTSAQSVTILDTTPGAVIHYTTDGTTPGPNSPVFSTPIAVNSTTTIEAIAIATGYNNSLVATGLYTISLTATTPTFNPLPGNFTSAQSVSILDTTPGAVIHYTTNGTTPSASSPVYSTAIAVTTTTTIEAIAIAPGYNNSLVATGLYTITLTAATPTFNPLPGNFTSAQSVSILDTTPGAVIHYTTNGTTPSASSPVFSTPIAVNTTTTIEAIAIAPGYNNSLVATGLYTITLTAATPTFNPLPGNFTSAQSVSILDTTPGAVIHYTTNGTTPSASSPVYSTAIAVNSTTTIEAIAIAPGYNNSLIATGLYTITLTAATPTFNPLPGNFTSAQSISILDTTPGVVIHYTTNGTTPSASSPVYSTAIAVNSTTTIEAIAIAPGYNNSLVATGLYTITLTAATPTFNPLPGNFTSAQSVSILDTTPGAVIHYTTNGTTPSASSPVFSTPIAVNTTTTIEAIAIAPGYNNNSLVATGLYTITLTAATPTFNPLPGNFTSAQSVSILDTTPGAVIHYTTNGTTPSASSPVFTTPISVSSTTTIEAIAIASGYNNSLIATGVYIITPLSSGTVINLSSYYNAFGIATVGTRIQGGGFDNDGNSYNSSLLGTSLSYGGFNFTLGPVNVLDAVFSQTMSVPAGQYNKLVLIGAGVNGAQTQNVTVYYTDGSSSTFTQSFSDWAHPSNFSGETTVIQTASRINSNGQTQTGTYDVYGYTFSLNSSKTVSKVGLPNSRNVVFLGAALAGTTSTGTPIVPYIQVNNGVWQQTATTTVSLFSSVNLGPQPLTGGSWSWTGPFGYSSTSRQINNIPLAWGANTYTATYTNTSGVKSTQVFTITVSGFGSTLRKTNLIRIPR